MGANGVVPESDVSSIETFGVSSPSCGITRSPGVPGVPGSSNSSTSSISSSMPSSSSSSSMIWLLRVAGRPAAMSEPLANWPGTGELTIPPPDTIRLDVWIIGPLNKCRFRRANTRFGEVEYSNGGAASLKDDGMWPA